MSKLTNQELEEKIKSLTDRELIEKNAKYNYLIERHLQSISFFVSFFFWLFIVSLAIAFIVLITQSS